MGGRTQLKAANSLQGSITVYCSLVLLLMAALIGSLLESAHLAGVGVRAVQVMATGLDSLFSMYDQGLYEQYGLLFLNEELLSLSLEEQLEEFVFQNADLNQGFSVRTPQFLAFCPEEVCIDALYYAVDDEGIFLERQVLELMKYQETASLLGQLQSYLAQIANGDQAYSYVVEQNGDYEETDWGELAGLEEDAGQTGGETLPPSGEGETSEITQEDIDASLEGSIITQVQGLLTDTLLSLFVDDMSAVSEKSRREEVSFGVSHNIAVDGGLMEDLGRSVLYNEYLMQYMGSFLHPSGGAGLDYELEYILGGAQSDKENLLTVFTRLLFTRMGLNIIFLLANHSHSQEAELMAGTLVGWTGIVPLVKAVKLLLIAVWAFAESILDVRALLCGKKVAFFKSGSTWNTSISDCVARVAAGDRAEASSSGIGYEIYLRIFLLSQNMQEKCLRTMNLIQWNLKERGQGFSFSSCVYGMEVTMRYSAKPVFVSMYAGVYRGEESFGGSVGWSQTY